FSRSADHYRCFVRSYPERILPLLKRHLYEKIRQAHCIFSSDFQKQQYSTFPVASFKKFDVKPEKKFLGIVIDFSAAQREDFSSSI
ncbi:hypothetical protein HMPREF1544_00395, partial [Mucor circinelloides 1006PhL]